MYDIIIVGSGVAGSYLASKLSGLNLLLIEKDKNLVLKDSGIVSGSFLDFFDGPIKKEVNRIDCFSPSGHRFTLHSREPFAYILKRETFSRQLRSAARKNARIVYGTVQKITYEKDFVTVDTDNNSYRAKLVVGADGAGSVVRVSAGIAHPKLSLGIMVKTKSIDGHINVFFNKHYSPDFFSWIIPQNNEYGTITSIRPREYLEYFKREQYLQDGHLIAHLIPTGYVKSYSHRMMLVGDACGQNKPLTGGGIIFGLKAAGHAAEILSRGDFRTRKLAQYERAWKKDFGMEIRKQLLFRKIYRRLTNNQIDKIFLDVGPEIEKLDGFDYDKFTKSWIRMSKFRLFRAALAAV